jgi:predicted membrane-bound mannosyltransferase
VPALALLAAGAFAAIPNGALAAFVALAVIAMQGFQTHRAVVVYPADERNPYAYVHSSPDVLKFRALVTAALTRAPERPVRIVSEEYWPLPWYLRGLPRVGYWSTPPDDCDGALVITSATQAAAVRAKLHGNYRESFLGLRPGFLCVVFTPSS